MYYVYMKKHHIYNKKLHIIWKTHWIACLYSFWRILQADSNYGYELYKNWSFLNILLMKIGLMSAVNTLHNYAVKILKQVTHIGNHIWLVWKVEVGLPQGVWISTGIAKRCRHASSKVDQISHASGHSLSNYYSTHTNTKTNIKKTHMKHSVCTVSAFSFQNSFLFIIILFHGWFDSTICLLRKCWNGSHITSDTTSHMWGDQAEWVVYREYRFSTYIQLWYAIIFLLYFLFSAGQNCLHLWNLEP